MKFIGVSATRALVLLVLGCSAQDTGDADADDGSTEVAGTDDSDAEGESETSEQPVCGDGMLEAPDEQCDGDALAGMTCAGLGFYAGTLGCSSRTCTFDTSECRVECDPSLEVCSCEDTSDCPRGYICWMSVGDEPEGACGPL